MLKSFRISFFVFALILLLSVFTVVMAEDGSEQFESEILKLQEGGSLPTRNWSYYKIDNYEDEWAQMYWYRWNSFMDDVKDFVIRAKISWDSANETPQWDNSGCGFIFRENEGEHLRASIFLDGFVHLKGIRGFDDLSYQKMPYGPASTSGSQEFVLSVYENRITMMVDGRVVFKRSDLALNEAGSLGFVVDSGTNKDEGIQCKFEDIELYVLD